MANLTALPLAAALIASACAAPASHTTNPEPPRAPSETAPAPTGVMVMAHGGSPEWNRSVARAIEPLREKLPVALALGMADPRTMQAALDSLASRGVERVAVVRLFLSGASFLDQTEFLLGLREDPPAKPMLHGGGGHHAALHPLRRDVEVLVSREGMAASPHAARILVERALEASREPQRERVLLLAHGMGDDQENAELLAWMEGSVAELRRLGFQAAEAATLREDWPEARFEAERRIRAWVEEGEETGARTLVVPFRLSGFGPYAEVLEGLSYTPTEGLLPHERVTRWIEEEAARLLSSGALNSSVARSSR